MTTVVEHIEGGYEVHELPYGKDYAWCPECVVVECECGQRLTLTAAETKCRCGADHTSLVREALHSRRLSEGASHPWDDEYQEWREKQDEYLLSEEHYQLELNTVE